MKKINPSVRVTELDTLSDVLVRLYKDSSSDKSSVFAKDANLLAIMTEIETLSEQITTAINCDKVFSSLDEADIVRDGIIRNLADALTGYSSIPIASKKASAEKLLAIFNKYGKQMVNKSYAEESSLIVSMIEDFSAQNLSDDISSLDGIGELIKSLKIAQDDFNKKNDEYTAANVSKAQSASVVKKSLLTVINSKFVPYISAVGALEGYSNFVSKCEAEIVKANAVVKERAKSAEKK